MKPLIFNGVGLVPIETVMGYWRENCTRDLPWTNVRPPNTQQICIVGGAPSLKETLPSIRTKRQLGARVWALNNAWRALAAAGIKFDAILLMDSRPENVEFLAGGPDVEYLISATCHPDIFAALAGKRVTLWFPDQGRGIEQGTMHAQRPNHGVLLQGGGTVGLRAMVLAHALGYRKLHLYGMDSCYHGKEHHAYPQWLNDGERAIDIHLRGVTYWCAPWMARQADEFNETWNRLTQWGCTIQAHGRGLIPDMCRILNTERGNRRRKHAA